LQRRKHKNAVQQLQLRTVLHEEASESQAMRVYTQHLQAAQGHAGAPQAVQQQAWAFERGRFLEEIQELKAELATKAMESSKHTRILEMELKREKEATKAMTEDAARVCLEASEASKQSEALRAELQKQLATRATSSEAAKGTIMQLEMELRQEVQVVKAAAAKELELHQEVHATKVASAKATEAICEAAEHIRVLERDKALSLEAAEDARAEASEVATCLRAVLKNPSWCNPAGEDRSGKGVNADGGHGPKETMRFGRLEQECAELRQELREAMNASTGCASIMVRAETAEAAVRQLQGQVAGLDMEARSQVKLARLEAAKNAAVASSETARAEGLAHERQMLEDQLRGIQFQSKDLCDELGALKTAAAAVRSVATSKDDIIDELKAERAALARHLRAQIIENGDLDETIKTQRQPPRFGTQAAPCGSAASAGASLGNAGQGAGQDPRPSFMSVVNLVAAVESFMSSRNSAAPSCQSTDDPTSTPSGIGYVQRARNLSPSASSELCERLSDSSRSRAQDGNPAQQGPAIARPALAGGKHLVGQGQTNMPPKMQPCSRVAAAVADALTQAPRVESTGSTGMVRVAPGGFIPPEIERGSPERTTPKDVPSVSRRPSAGVDAGVPNGVIGQFKEELSALWRLYTHKAEVTANNAPERQRSEGVPSDQTIRRHDCKDVPGTDNSGPMKDATSPKEDTKRNAVAGQASIHSGATGPFTARAVPRLSQTDGPTPPNAHPHPWARPGVPVESIRKQDCRDAAGPDGGAARDAAAWPAQGTTQASKGSPPPVCHPRNSGRPSMHTSPVGSTERHLTTPTAPVTLQVQPSSLRSPASLQNPALRYRSTSPQQVGMHSSQAQSLSSSTGMPPPAGSQPPHHASSPLQMAPPMAMRQGGRPYQAAGHTPGVVYRAA